MSTTTRDLVLPGLAELVRPQGPQWSPDRLRDLVTRVAATHSNALLDLVRFASPARWWARLALTEEVELWLLSWLPGQRTEPHDHGGAAGGRDPRRCRPAVAGGAGKGTGRTVTAVDDALAAARTGLHRLTPAAAAGLDDVLFVDVRPAHNRAEGEIAGSVAADRARVAPRPARREPHRRVHRGRRGGRGVQRWLPRPGRGRAAGPPGPGTDDHLRFVRAALSAARAGRGTGAGSRNVW